MPVFPGGAAWTDRFDWRGGGEAADAVEAEASAIAQC